MLENALREDKPVLLVELLHLILKHVGPVALLLAQYVAFREEAVHWIVGPPRKVLKTCCKTDFRSQQVVVAKMVYDLEVMQVVVKRLNVILVVLLADTWTINTVSLDGKL